MTPEQIKKVGDLGLDRENLVSRGRAGDKFRIEVVLSRSQAAKLEASGVTLAEKKVDGATVSKRLSEQNASGYTVFRSYSEPGGIRDELVDLSEQYPKLTKLVRIGRTVQGQDILAIKVTKNAKRVADGRRPAVLYSSAQHAREWITPEMNRRLLRYMLDQYASNAAIQKVVDRTELWFVPVANPDGYDHTFTEGNRLWRKNLRDNDGDGAITGFDGVDLNRNFPYRWGYDNEGSSAVPTSETYRGTGAGLRAGDPGAERADAAGRLRVPDQLPLGGRTAALRRRLAGRHPDAGRPAVRDPGRRRRQPRGPRLRPGHRRGALHDQRRDHRARPQPVRHPGVHPGDVDLSRPRARSTRTTRTSPRTARASSTSPTPRPWCRRSSRRTSRSPWLSLSRRRTRTTRYRWSGGRRRTSRWTASPPPTVIRSRSR